MVALGTGVANAAVPNFPDNIVVFPNRDMVVLEDYQSHLGETATVEVKRGSTVIGSARSVVGPGDVAFEINHPGGVCWGAGTGLNVTPDIKPGDVVSVDFGAGEPDTTTVADTFVDAPATLVGKTLTVTGHMGAGVNQAQFEQRLINPDLVDTDVARRDVRAAAGPLTPAAKGGYRSGVVFAEGKFTATYEFDTQATADLAVASGGERAMAWEAVDGDANRQGLTIAEFGEPGGPGMGGCPAGPGEQAAPAGSYSFVRSAADRGKLQVNWTPATPAPGAAAVSGYSVEAIAPANNSGVSSTVGARTSETGKTVTLTVDETTEYKVEVRSLAGAKMSEAFPLAPTSTPAPPPTGDQTTPKLSFTPAPAADGAAVEADKVTLASETGADLYYTTDGSAVVNGDLPADNAKLYTSPIAITAATEIHAVAFDRAGNMAELTAKYTPVTVKAPLAAPTNLKATAGQAQVKLDWSAVTGAASYQVSVSPAVTPAPASTTGLTQTITGLTGGTEYTFSVVAKDVDRTSAASVVKATPAVVTARVVITVGRWKNADARIQGTTNTAANAGTIRFYRKSATGTFSTQYAGAVALAAAVAPATGSTFDGRFRTTAQTGTTNPGQIVAKLTDATGKELGVSAPFTLVTG
ncbi:MAG TPA: FN3 associated domain-containing protein [Propionibacteriaceae bacterium]|nr:FN3 associated domain-containing protein [Propionibacteriaceae bacterium]